MEGTFMKKLMYFILLLNQNALGMNKNKLQPTPSWEDVYKIIAKVSLEANDELLIISAIQNGADIKPILSAGNIIGIKYLLDNNFISPQKPIPGSTETPIHYYQKRYLGANKFEILEMLSNYKKSCTASNTETK
jgi:hypothetical protein